MSKKGAKHESMKDYDEKGEKDGEGCILHPDMTNYPDGVGSADPHASAEYRSANKAHGMKHGMGHKRGDGSDEAGMEKTGKGMQHNATYHE
jgi:hypothetical protein